MKRFFSKYKYILKKVPSHVFFLIKVFIENTNVPKTFHKSYVQYMIISDELGKYIFIFFL